MTNHLSATGDKPQKTLLIVDDSPENLSALGEMLLPHFRVRVANSGVRALAAAASEPRPDLIMLDVVMPGLDGYEVIARLHANPATRDIPVIFITASDIAEDETRGLELGAADYLTKPVHPAIVLMRVRCQLELKEARDRQRDQNAWLEAEIKRRMRQNQMIQDVSMRALASLAEARDYETGNHILRTQGYVGVLAHEMSKLPKYANSLTAETIESFAKAATLHDIGKVGIPDHALHKPGKHTQEEWEIMKTHAKVGSDAIWRAIQDEEDQAGLDFLRIAMDIAHYHHEKWDGSGYPDGLRGEAIPLAARMMALADVFDALITPRVYKPGFALDKVTEMILEGRDKHFDPEVVDAFIARLDDFCAIAARHADALKKRGG
ncbi:MAG: HD-GYP domain-containing protein [Candidatus Methylumidiphilus sp.]